jgi:Flp pilus assembly protein TadD
MYTRSLFLLSFVTALMTCSGALAQSGPSADWHSVPVPWPASDRANGQFSRSIVTLHELAHKIAGEARKEFESAIKAEKKGDEVSAIKHFKKAVAIDPEYVDALNNLGVSFLHRKRTDLAVEQFNKAIAIDPHAAIPYCNLALALLMQNKLTDAERAARQNVKLDDAGTWGRLVLGFTLVLQKKFTPEAERNLRIAVGQFSQASLLLAPILAARGEIENAKEQLKLYLASGDRSWVDVANGWMQQLNSHKHTQ